MTSYGKEHYKNNKQYYKDRNKKRRQTKTGSTFEFKRWLNEYKSTNPCIDCGKKYPYYVMDFDHIEEKSCNVSRLASTGRTAKARLEIEKCDLVCSNCHRCRTHNRRISL